MSTFGDYISRIPWRKVVVMILILASYIFFMSVTFLDIPRDIELPLLLQVIAILSIGCTICLGYVDIRQSNNRILIALRFVIGIGFLGYVMQDLDGIFELWDIYHRHITAWFILLIAMCCLLYFKWIYHINSVHIRSRPLMYTGMGFYGLLSSAVLACLIVGSYPYIPFDCNDLQEYSGSVVTAITDPVAQGIKKTQSGVGVVTQFLTTDIGNIVFGEAYIYTGDTTGEEKSLSQIDQRIVLEVGQGEELVGQSTVISEDIGTGTGLVGYIDYFKTKRLNQLVSDQELVNSSICEGVLELLIERRNDGGLKLSVIGILFVLLSPFVGFVMLILTVICFLLFSIGKKLRVWRIRRVLMEVEEVV